MPDGRNWWLYKSFTYEAGCLGSGHEIHVPAGFITDFASIPFPLWSFLPYYGRYGKAAVIHDYLYFTLPGMTPEEVKGKYPWLYEEIYNPRLWADNMFREAMEVEQCPGWQVNVIYRAVRLFAWFAWNNRRKQIAAEVMRRLTE